MRSVSSSDLLEVWERGASLHPIDQGLLILRLAFPDIPYDALADWPLGSRNSALAKVRCALSGSEMSGWVACPRCNEKLEFQIDAGAFSDPAAAPRHSQVSVNGRLFRLPSSRDLAQVAGEPDAEAATRKLLQLCCLGEAPAPDSWSDIDVEEIGRRMSEADSLAETRLSFSCPQCGEEWSENLEIAQFLWVEIEAQAKALLRDVYILARAYGWTERDILALSEARRTAYLEMVE